MSIKLIAILFTFLLAGFVNMVMAQPAHTCGIVAEVVNGRVDNNGYAPRAAIGSEAQFNCVVGRDASFLQRRFPTSWEAANYFFVLYGQELGVSLQPIPAPTN
jgi:hypothetical protein